MKYIVELNPNGSVTQVEVEAISLVDAVEQAWAQSFIEPEVVDGDQERAYRATDDGRKWQRIVINVLPGGYDCDNGVCDGEPCGTYRDDDGCCAVCGE